MKKSLIIRISPYGFFESLLAFTLILQGQSIFMTIPNLHLGTVMLISLIFCVFGCCCFSTPNSTRVHAFDRTLILLVYLVVYLLFRSTNFAAYVRAVIACCTLYYFFSSRTQQYAYRLLRKYADIVCIIATVSMFFWIFGELLHLIPVTGYITSGWSGNNLRVPTYFGLYFITQTDHWEFIRNCGIFAETPMFSFHLCVALGIEVVLNKKTNIAKTILLLVSIFSTRSTSGYIFALAVILYALYLRKQEKITVFRVITYFSLVVIVPIAVAAAYTLFSKKLGSASGSARLDDYIVGFTVWREHPVFGCGFDNLPYLQKYMHSFRSWTNGFSNAITYVLATGGLYLFILYIYPFIHGIACSQNRDKFVFVLLILYLFVIAIIPNAYILYSLLAWFTTL